MPPIFNEEPPPSISEAVDDEQPPNEANVEQTEDEEEEIDEQTEAGKIRTISHKKFKILNMAGLVLKLLNK